MPAGTWNLPKIQKTVPYRGIKDISTISIFDTTPTSDNYFNILQFPDRLTSGKNLFKLNAANDTLVDGSEIHIEILDYNGDPIYFEPLTYLEQDGTRVISVYIYPNTSPGLATVYIAGRARVNVFDNNRVLPYSDTLDTNAAINPLTGELFGNALGRAAPGNRGEQIALFKDFPNLLWQRTINVAPEKRNSSEIIFTTNPRVTVAERVVNYQQPITLNNVNVATSASNATISVAPIPSQGGLIANASGLNASYGLSATTYETMEGATSRATPVRSSGAPVSMVSLFQGPGAQSVNITNNNSIIALVNRNIEEPADIPPSQTSQGVTLSTGFSRATVTGFEFSASMEGGLIIVQNPILSVDLGTALQGSPLAVMPAAEAGNLRNFIPDAMSVATDINMSGSVVFQISEVESTTQAKVAQLAGPGHNAPSLTAFNFVALKSSINAQTPSQGLAEPIAYDIKSIQATANFTSSHTLPLVLSTTEQSQSFAEVVLANIEPATGDVYKIRTSYKPAGQFGDFISAGDTILERFELLEDTGSFEGTMAIGQIFNRMGYFTDLSDFNTYFEVDTGNNLGVGDITFNNDTFMNSVTFTPTNGYTPFVSGDADNGIAFKLKSTKLPTVQKNTRYSVSLKTKCISDLNGVRDEYTYTQGDETSIISKPRFDIYILGSEGQNTIEPVATTYGAFRLTDYNLDPTLQGRLADDNELGRLIGTVEMNESTTTDNSILNVFLSFESSELQNINLFIVPRRGTFAFKELSITTDAETGFSPNHMRLNIRIPSEFINVPMIFKFEYFDYLGTRADTETTVYPIKFVGDNTVLTGGNNLITGSVFVGNAVGSGIELAGVRSGFIRTIGYEGFLSASHTDKPGGFLMYTGSVLPDAPDSYSGVGLELVADSGSFLRFATDELVSDKPAGLEVRTPRFFLGSDSQFISGANGNIEISSSDFHLTRGGSVTMTGTITATAGGDIGGWNIGTSALSSSNNTVVLDADGPYYISSSGFQVGENGSVTASTGLIAGFVIDDHSLSTTGVEINDSGETLFISSSKFKVTHAGNITASNIRLSGHVEASSGEIGGFSISSDAITGGNDSTRFFISGGAISNGLFISSSGFNVRATGDVTGSKVLFTGGRIAGWEIVNNTLQSLGYGAGNQGILIDGSESDPLIDIREDNNNRVKLFYSDSVNYGISATEGGSTTFQLGSTNQIAGWTFDQNEFVGGQMIIRKDGTIESAGFASNVAGSGFRLTANQGGFLEVENAKIRGTLATATFEKETVNAVGGQLYVANSTTLTGSGQLAADTAPLGTHRSTDTTMSVANVTGFAVDEIITAKKVSSTGFATEYMLIESSSRDAGDSDTDFTGKLFVRRGYSGSIPAAGQTSASLGDIASSAQGYSGSQVIVSTGKIGTGYIRLNANPNDPTTPYIDIVERTGSAIYDIDLKARLGDLSGLSSAKLQGTDPASAGFGLYSQNVFLEGGIVANTGSIADIKMQDSRIFTGVGNHGNSDTGFYIDSSSKFALGDKLVWDGSTLNVQGAITVTNTSDFVTPSITASFLSTDDTGSMLAAATGGLFSSDDTGSMLAAATSSLVAMNMTSSLENPIQYSFGGNGFDLTGHTAAEGLNLTSEFLGYHNGTTFQTFMSSSGDFLLGGGSGSGVFQWNHSNQSLSMSGSLVELNCPTFFFGAVGDSPSVFISGSQGKLEISSSNFHLQRGGDVIVRGNITVLGGELTASITDFPSDENLIGYYPLHSTVITDSGNERVLDFSGNNRHGDDAANSIGADVTFASGSESGPLPGAAEFANSANSGQIKLTALKNGLSADMNISISWWHKKTTNAKAVPWTFHTDQQSSDTDQLQCVFQDGGADSNDIKLLTDHVSAGVVDVSTSDIDLDDSQWHHFVLTVEDAANALLYADGELIATFSTSINTEHLNSLDLISLGSSLNTADGSTIDPWIGYISEFRVYSGILTQNNARALFNSPSGPVTAGTRITGDMISTGKIKSKNFSNSAGSIFDLDAGTFKMGGSSSPKLEFDGSTLSINGSVTSTSGTIGGWSISSTKLSANSTTAANHIALDKGNAKIQLGGNSKTRTIIETDNLQFFSGSNNEASIQFQSEYVPQQGFVTLAGGTVGGGGVASNPMIGQAMWNFGGGGQPAFSGSVRLTALIISGARYEVNPETGNDSVIRQTQLLVDDKKNEVFSSVTAGSIIIQNDSVDTDHSSGGVTVYRRTPAIQVIQNQGNTPFAGQSEAAVFLQTKAGTFATLEVEDQVGTANGSLLLDVEHTSNSSNETITGISAGPVAQMISLEGAGATQHNEGAIGLLINMDDSYDDALTAAIYCDNQIVTTHEVTAFFSDERLKDFEGKIPNALEKLSKINGYYFRNNDRANEVGYSGKKLQIGVSAQEVKEVLPEIIKKAGVKAHHQPTDEDPYMTLDYGKLTPLLIEAVKELQAEVNELKKKLGE